MGYIPRSEGYIPRFLQGTIVLGTVVIALLWTLVKFLARRKNAGRKQFSKIAAREQKSHTLNNIIVEHHHGRPATAFWQAGGDSIHCKGKRSTCSVWRCCLPSRTVFSLISLLPQNKRTGGFIVVCVFPFIFVIDAALLFLYGIMFFVYTHSLGCHRTHFPAPIHFISSVSLPIHIWFLSVDCCI